MRQILLSVLILPILLMGSVAQAGVIAYYNFDGNSNDSIGGNDGQNFGDTTFSTGYLGQAVSFDGDSDYVRLSSTLLGSLTNWSMTGFMYLNPTDYANTGFAQRSSFYGEYSSTPNGDTDNYLVYNEQTGGVSYDTFPPSGGATSSRTLDDNTWYAFAVVRDGSDIRIYIDGILEGQGTYETYTGVPATFATFGARMQDLNTVYTPSNPLKYSMNGMLDEIRIYDYSLTAQEISVPEPESIMMFILAIIGLVVQRKRIA